MRVNSNIDKYTKEFIRSHRVMHNCTVYNDSVRDDKISNDAKFLCIRSYMYIDKLLLYIGEDRMIIQWDKFIDFKII